MTVTYIISECRKCGFKSVEKESELGLASRILLKERCPNCSDGKLERSRKSF